MCVCAILVCDGFCVQEIRQAHERLANPDDVDPTLFSQLERPSYAEILSQALPGETVFVWQRQVERPEGSPIEDDGWQHLPECVSRVLDRDFARFVNVREGFKIHDVSAFAIHLRFQSEIRPCWVSERTRQSDNGSRSWIKPNKVAVLVNFDRKKLEIQVDGNKWHSVRCVKVTHTGGEVVQQGDLHELLQQRLRDYIDADSGSEWNEQPEEQDLAEEEVLGAMAPLGDMGMPDENENGFLQAGIVQSYVSATSSTVLF